MIWTILANVAMSVLGFAQKRSDAAVERYREDAQTTRAAIAANAAVVQTGMGVKAFWVPWLIATVPLSMWFGWGMLDSLANGALPDVAKLPPQLQRYADIAWANIFYAGGGVAGVQVAARTVSQVVRNWR